MQLLGAHLSENRLYLLKSQTLSVLCYNTDCNRLFGRTHSWTSARKEAEWAFAPYNFSSILLKQCCLGECLTFVFLSLLMLPGLEF